MKKVKVNFQTSYFSEHCYKSAQPTFSQKDLQFVIRVFSIIWTKTQVGKKDILFDKMFLKRLKYTLLKLDKLCSLFFFSAIITAMLIVYRKNLRLVEKIGHPMHCPREIVHVMKVCFWEFEHYLAGS